MLNDDLISAYLDGEHDAERRAMVEHHLRTDAGAAARLERMRGADDVLKRAFASRDFAKDDDVLATMILSPQRVVGPRDWMKRAAALAAAAVFGLVIGQAVRGDGAQTPYAISAQEAQLLDTQMSGRVTNISTGAFEVVLSLRSDAGQMCRQFRLTRDMQSTDVLACKRDGEEWRMVAAAQAVGVEGYVPAGSNSPLDAAIETLGAVQALDSSEEAAQIEGGWRHLP
jgi:hypothetical protein